MNTRPCMTCGTQFTPVAKSRYCSWDCRHGTDAGYAAGCKCAPCRAAHSRQRNLNRLYPAARSAVPAIGTHRRIEALACLGWSASELSGRLGRHRSYLRKALDRNTLERPTVLLVAQIYDALSMTIHKDTPASRRTSAAALARGAVPPLGWVNIDDPDENPTGWQYDPEDPAARADTLRDVAARGAGISEACRVLGVTRAALQKWCGNNDLTPLYLQLVSREDGLGHSNQHRSEVA